MSRITAPPPSTPFQGAHAANYLDGPRRQVPGLDGLHKMMSQLLAEHAPADAHILVLGAGGGLELRTLGDAHPHWHFTGVDPSADMLRLAAETAAPHMPRIALQQGYIEDAPESPFDGATCLLTFHFIPPEQRRETLRQLRRRLRPSAPLVLAHISFPQSEAESDLWLSRHLVYGGADGAGLDSARAAMRSRLTILAPEKEEAMLAEAGFTGTSLFYAALSFRGWVAYA